MTDVERYELRNRLRVVRAERSLSQAALAGLAGVTRQTISAIENGQYVPSARLAFVLAAVTDNDVNDVFHLEVNTDDGEQRDAGR